MLAADADVAGIDAVLGQGSRAVGILREQEVSVVVEVADDRHAHAVLIESFDDRRNGGGSFFVVDRDADQFRPGPRQRHHLLHGRGNIRRVGVGHRLHHNWCIAADSHAANRAGNGFSALNSAMGNYFNTEGSSQLSALSFST